MRPIHLTRLDKTRPALLLTRELAVPHLTWITVAPITSRIRGIGVEVPVGPTNGIDHDAVINLDNIMTSRSQASVARSVVCFTTRNSRSPKPSMLRSTSSDCTTSYRTGIGEISSPG